MKLRWVAVAVMVLFFVAAIAAGYRWGPRAVAAAQNLELAVSTAQAQVDEPTPTPKPKPAKKEQNTRGWLGIQVSTSDGGAQVTAVMPNSPAAGAGLQQGDVLTAVDGQAVASAQQLVESISKRKPGDKVTLSIKRDGTTKDLSVTLGTPQRVPVKPNFLPLPDLLPPLANPLGPLGSLLPEWRELPADQQFEHLNGGSFSFTDKNGQQVSVDVVAGVVGSVAAGSITMRPNGESADRSYAIDAETRLFPGNRANITETMKKDDRVLVVARRVGDRVTTLAIYDQTAVSQRRGFQRPEGSVQPKGSGRPGGNFHFRLPGWPGKLLPDKPGAAS